MQIYSKNNKNCFFSLISWPIFILFVLSDRARWGLQNLYKFFSQFNNYANLCKFIQNHKKCFFSFISQPILIWFALSGRAKLGTLNVYTEFWDFAPLVNYGNLCKFIPKKNCFFSLISLPIFILFVLSDRARWGLQNLYTKFWNSLIMLIYANLFKITKKCLELPFSTHFDLVCFIS